jgi:hypothetical protein
VSLLPLDQEVLTTWVTDRCGDILARDLVLTFETAKSEDLNLFRHSELAYEHLILAPPKTKGQSLQR